MTVIELKNVSKKYFLKFQKRALIKDFLPRIFMPNIRKDFWALQDINLKVNQGEVLGIIGDNGAGKTTLLSIVAKITFPTEGNVYTSGRVYPLLSLGAGFHRELSGEDNVYLNGLLLGLKMDEIRERIDKIIEFSELGGFIKQPIYTYSSGMLLRLGFAIAVHVDFDILLLDEVLSVGDIPFQGKCIDKIKEFIKSGKTIVISSQSLDMIQELTERVILLDKGKVIKEGKPLDAISFYKDLIERKNRFIRGIQLLKSLPEDIERIRSGWGKKFGNGKSEILNVDFIGKDGKRLDFRTGEPLTISVDAEIKEKIYNPHFGIAIFRDDYTYCHGPNTKFDGITIREMNPGRINFKLHYPKFILKSGNYKVSVAIWDEEEKSPYIYHCAYYDFKIATESTNTDKDLLDIEHSWYLLEDFKRRLEIEKASNFKLEDKLFNSPSEIDIQNIYLRDYKFKIKEMFFTGEFLALIIELSTLRKEDLFLAVKLLKSDGLLCHHTGVILRARNSYRLMLEYPNLPVLTGEYGFYIYAQDSVLFKSYNYKWKRFSVLSRIRDHGIVYMAHKWFITK